MSAKKTYLYEVILSKCNGEKNRMYFFARNKFAITLFCKENVYEYFKYDKIDANPLGEYRYPMKEPVRPCTEDEIKIIKGQIKERIAEQEDQENDKFIETEGRIE